MVRYIGTLAVICAQRKNTLFQILNGTVTLHIGKDPDKKSVIVKLDNELEIRKLVHEFNFGQYKNEGK